MPGFALLLLGCHPCAPYCQDDDLVLASSIDEADWPEGWPEAWADILEFQGTWLVAAVSNDDAELALGELQLGISIDEDSLMLLPPETDVECREQDADGEVEISWGDGSTELAPAEIDIFPDDSPTEHGGTRGEVQVHRKGMHMSLFGDGGFSSTFTSPNGTGALIEASAEDHLSTE